MKSSILKGYAGMGELTLGLTEHFVFHNAECPHQSLGNRTPDRVYVSRRGGGAVIVDKFGKHEKSETYSNTGAAPTRCVCRGMYSLNSACFCLDSGVYFKLLKSYIR